MKKHLFAVTLISALFASSVLAADNTPTAPDFGKFRESAAAPFRLLGNLISGNKAEAATAQPDQSAQSDDEPAIAVTSTGGMKVEFRQNSQWITVTHACMPNNCGYWDARVWLKKKGVTVAVDLELTAVGINSHDLLGAGFGVLAPSQAPECEPCILPQGVLLTPGEYLIQVTPFVSYKKELEHKKVQATGLIRLGVLTVTKNSITARKLGNVNEAEFLGKKSNLFN